MKGIANRVPRGFRNFQSLHLKTVDSIALPIYNSLPPQPTKLPGVGEEDTAPVIKKIKLSEDSESCSEGEEDHDESITQEQVDTEIPVADGEPQPTVTKSKHLKVSDYVDATLKHTALTPVTMEIRGGLKRKVSSRKSLGASGMRVLSSKKVRGSTIISSRYEKAERNRRRRTMN